MRSCKAKSLDKSKRIKIPAIFDGENEEDQKPSAECIDDRTAKDVLISGKFHALTPRVFDNIIYCNHHAEFPFDITSNEVEVINHFQTPAFILGRSGTGKTTCLLYKLLNRYLASAQNSEEPDRIRQVLLTRSEPLSRKLKMELQRLIKTQLIRVVGGNADRERDGDDDMNEAGGEATENTGATLLSRTLFSLNQEDFPLVCTFAEFMLILQNTIRYVLLPDIRVKPSFF